MERVDDLALSVWLGTGKVVFAFVVAEVATTGRAATKTRVNAVRRMNAGCNARQTDDAEIANAPLMASTPKCHIPSSHLHIHTSLIAWSTVNPSAT